MDKDIVTGVTVALQFIMLPFAVIAVVLFLKRWWRELVIIGCLKAFIVSIIDEERFGNTYAKPILIIAMLAASVPIIGLIWCISWVIQGAVAAWKWAASIGSGDVDPGSWFASLPAWGTVGMWALWISGGLVALFAVFLVSLGIASLWETWTLRRFEQSQIYREYQASRSNSPNRAQEATSQQADHPRSDDPELDEFYRLAYGGE